MDQPELHRKKKAKSDSQAAKKKSVHHYGQSKGAHHCP